MLNYNSAATQLHQLQKKQNFHSEAYRHRENVAFAVIVENSTTQFDVEETADDEQQRNEKHDNARYGER